METPIPPNNCHIVGFNDLSKAHKSSIKPLTCSDLHVSGDDPAEAVRRHAPVHRVVDVLAVGGGRKWQQQERAVA